MLRRITWVLLGTALALPLSSAPSLAGLGSPFVATAHATAHPEHEGDAGSHEHPDGHSDAHSDAHHDEAHESGIRWVSPILGNEGKTGVVWLLINFAALMWILNRLLFTPLRNRQASEHGRVKAELQEATSARQEAEAVIREYRGRMERVDAEVAELLAQAKARAEADRAQVLADAQREAHRIRAAAAAAAERDAEAARRAIEAEVLDRAIARAESLLRERIRPSDQQRLLEDYLQRLDQVDLRGGVA